MELQKKDNAISICRVVSMAMILICHIISNYTFLPGHNVLGSFFDSAVYTFIGLSGYLYGKKTIDKFSKWIAKRAITVMVPASIFAAVVLIVKTILKDKISVLTYVIYLLNLRGITFAFPLKFIKFDELPVLGPLWFIAIIMICYLLVPLFQKIRNFKINNLLLFGIGGVVMLLNILTSVNLTYFFAFFICYYFSAHDTLKKLTPIKYVIITVVNVVLQAGHIVLNLKFKDNAIYAPYVSIAHCVLGVWVMITLIGISNLILKKRPMPEKLQKIVYWIDGISFFVYITQGCFFRGRLNAYELSSNLFVATILFFGMTIISAIVLKIISTPITNKLQKLVR